MNTQVEESMSDKLDSMTVEVKTPDGVLYYTICEENGVPVKVISTFGKAGTSLAAWANAVDILVNMLLERKVSIHILIEALSQITANKSMRTPKGIKIGSGPEGLVIALLEYRRQKYIEFNKMLG